MAVTVTKTDASRWFDSDGSGNRMVLTTTAPVSQFSTQVEIRIPLPAEATPADTTNVRAGVVDPESGAVTVERSTIRMIDGKPFMVVNTNHFTSRIFEWLLGKQPPSSALLSVPYYNQGSSNYCWAASLHMVTQATDFEQLRLVTDIIGKAGIDEEGITSVAFRMSGPVADLVQERTGVRPDRKMWDDVNANLVRDYLWQEVGVNGRPVAVYVGTWEHAVVVVGYDMNTFRVHDPNATSNGAIGYTTKEWSTFVEGMGIKDRIVTLVVPKAIKDGDRVAVSFLSQAFQFTKPGYGSDAPSAVFEYYWDYTQPIGYSFRHMTSRELAAPLPGEVDRLKTVAEIQLSNSSRTTARDVSVYLDITAMGAPTGVGRLSTHRNVTVGPNALVNLSVPEILVDTFRYNTPEPTEYVLTVSALTGGTTVDQQSLRFTLAPVTPEIAAVTPSEVTVGAEVTITGTRFGRLALNNTVTFNGTKVAKIVSWKDDAIKVVVPEGATDGPVLVTRGTVASNPVPFTIAKTSTLSGKVDKVFDGTILAGVKIDASVAWSLQAVGPSVKEQGEVYTRLYAKVGEAAVLTFDADATYTPSRYTYSSGAYAELKGIVWSFRPTIQGSFTPQESGSGMHRAFGFTLAYASDRVCIQPSFQILMDIYSKDGVLGTKDFLANGSGIGAFCVEAAP